MRIQVSIQLRPWLGGASLLSLLLLHFCTVVAALNPIEIHGYKMFDSVTGEEFVVRGIAYEPRPNAGIWNQNSIDYFTEEHRHIWERDIPYLQALGVNAVRLYAVDPTQNHDAFMCAMNAAGIYVLVSLARDCPTCAVTREEAPHCYPRQLKRQGEAVINAFSKYPNLLAFSAGNEVNHYTPHNNPEWNGPCQKRFLRDMRKYIASCSPTMRKVPVGLVSADSQRDAVSLYYNCANNDDDDDEDPYEHAEWFGLNVYLACNGSIINYEEEKGYTELVESFKSYNYSIPVMITEFGCLSETFPTVDGYEGQRTFQQARWLLQNEQLRDQFVGGYAFEYSIERQNAISESPYPFQTMGGQTYGIGYFSPEDCDDVTIPCQYNPEPCFDNLQEAYNHQDNSTTNTIHKDDFVIPPHRQGRTQCPTNFTTKLSSYQWKADRVRDLKCPSKGSDSNFVCPANLDELRPKLASSEQQQQHQSIWVTLLEAILFLTVVSIIYAMLMSQVDRMSKNHEKYMSVEGPTWMTVVVPVSRSSSHGGTNTTTKGSSTSGSGGSCEEQSTDESAGLLSMKGWNQYHYYQSVDSDLSDESSGKCQSSSQQEEEPDHYHHHRHAQAFLSSSPPPYYHDYGAAGV